MKRTKPLDPHKFERAVKIIAFLKAKTVVKAEIGARGEKISAYSCRDITARAEAYLAVNMEELITQAIAVVWRFPEFAKHRPTEGSHSLISRL